MTTKSFIVAFALLSLSFWASYALDSFGTAILSLPAFIFFTAISLKSLVTAIKKKNISELKPLLLAVIGFSVLIVSFKVSDHGLAQLTNAREQAMKDLQPVFSKYKKDHGEYPNKIEDLVPEYIPQIPVILCEFNDYGDPYKKITYSLENGKPLFRYQVIRGPDSNATFNMDSGKIEIEK